jgi:hypothetical protein
MKAGETKSAIEAFADALSFEGAPGAAARLRALLPIFDGFAKRPLRNLLDLLDKVTVGSPEDTDGLNEDSIGRVIRSLQSLEVILAKTSAPARKNDLVALRTRLQRHESATVGLLVGAVQVLRRGRSGGGSVEQNSEQLAEQLKAALGYDEQFKPLFKQLSGLKAKDVASVANLLMSSGSSGARQRDLNRIRERHESQRSLIAKERATAGRTAA